MRKSFDGLMAIIRDNYQLDPYANALFLFCGRDSRKLKALHFDKDGFVVETSQEVIEDVPKIEGLTCDSVVLYEKLPLANDTALKNLLSLTQLLQKYEIPSKRIKYEETSGSMTVYSGKITILVGNADNLAQKIMRLQYILPQLEGKKGTLHLENWTSETTDIIFDPKKSKKSK